MDPLRSFSDYDLLAHVPQGFLAFAATDYVFHTNAVLGRSDWNPGYVVLILVLSYIVGHLVAGPSQFILEKTVARSILGGSARNLLSHTGGKGFRQLLFPGYFEPAGYPIRTAVLARNGVAEVDKEAADRAFLAAYLEAREDEFTRSRLRTFLNMYGFCRNITFLGLLTTIGFVAIRALNSTPEAFFSGPTLWPMFGLTAATTLMMQRYLKFYRLYALEVFVASVRPRKTTPPGLKDRP